MKKILGLMMCLLFLLPLSGCSEFKIETDSTYFDEAVVSNLDGTSECVKIKSCIPYRNDQYIVVSENGTTYVVHKENVMLVRYRNG